MGHNNSRKDFIRRGVFDAHERTTMSPNATTRGRLNDVVEALTKGSRALAPDQAPPDCQMLPSRDIVVRLIEELRTVIFPRYVGTSVMTEEGVRYHIGATLDRSIVGLEEQIRRGICFSCRGEAPVEGCRERAAVLAASLLERLPEIQRLLITDVRAAFEGDPAAKSPDETVFCYPGILAITYQRIAHEFYRMGQTLLARIISEHAHSVTGIDIHPGARIGSHFFIDHGTGVVIGETAIIGNRVRLYQGVTLGAKSFPLDAQGNPIKSIDRHPILEDDVVVYAGATILGRITIGKGSVIGGNVWLTRDLPPGSRVSQKD
jgi:serine O-acetyltransferase